MLIYLKKLKVTKCDLAILSGENSEHESFCKTDKNSQMSKKKMIILRIFWWKVRVSEILKF